MANAVLNAVRLMPIRGKYYETSLPNYGPQRIWKVLPGNESKKVWGTPVPPDVAYTLLMIRPDVVKLAPPEPGESWTDCFTESQLADIKSKGLYGYPSKHRESKSTESSTPSSKETRALMRDIEGLRAENTELKAQLSQISDTLSKIMTTGSAS